MIKTLILTSTCASAFLVTMISSAHGQLETTAGTELSGGTKTGGTELSGGTRTGDTKTGGTESGTTVAGDPGWDGDPPKEDPPPPGEGDVRDTFDDNCSYTYKWDPSKGGVDTDGGGAAFQNVGISYNNEGVGGANRMCLKFEVDVTGISYNTDVFTFVINNGSAPNQGSSPATNALLIFDCNNGMSVYEYDVNPANDFTSGTFADLIFDTSETASLLNATYGCTTVTDPITGTITKTMSVCWDNGEIEDYFAALGVDPKNVRIDEKAGIWGRNWGGIDVNYATDPSTGGQYVDGWDVAWPEAGGADTNSFMDVVDGTEPCIVPESSTTLTSALGCLALALRRRRKN